MYSSVFDSVEIDSSFYRVPSPAMISAWNRVTPEGFVFTAKFPRKITHDRKLRDVEELTDWFHKTVQGLGKKLGPLLIQLPPSLKYEKDHGAFENFLTNLKPGFRYAVEFRHKSWFRDEVRKLLQQAGVSQCWSLNQYLSTPHDATADFLYVRFVGDRAITEFDRVQRDTSELMGSWHRAIKEVASDVAERFVFFNNHFAGFGPSSVNEFRRLAGLAEADWSFLSSTPKPQKSLFDFKN